MLFVTARLIAVSFNLSKFDNYLEISANLTCESQYVSLEESHFPLTIIIEIIILLKSISRYLVRSFYHLVTPRIPQ